MNNENLIKQKFDLETFQGFMYFVYAKQFKSSGIPRDLPKNIKIDQTFYFIEEYANLNGFILIPGSGGPYLKEKE